MTSTLELTLTESTPEKEPYWCSTAPNVPRVWSSSSLGTLMECPRKFELRYVEGWTQKGESLDLIFGTAFHSLQEAYAHARMAGADKDEALRQAIGAATPAYLPDPVREGQMGKTQEGLLTLFVAYHDHYENDLMNQVVMLESGPALEMNFSIISDLISPDGQPYQVRGYIDKLITFGGSYTCWDYKTTGGAKSAAISEFKMRKFEINIQNYVYTAATRTLSEFSFSQFLIDMASIFRRKSDGLYDFEFVRKPVQLTPGELDEGLQDIEATIRLAEYFAERNYYPKNTSACTFCEFNQICNKDPVMRITYLQSEFDEKRRTTIEVR